MGIGHEAATRTTLPGGTPVHVFEPAGTAQRAIVLFHERYGLVQHTLDLGAKLAGDGLLAFTPDLFEGKVDDYDAVRAGRERGVIYDHEVISTAEECLVRLRDDYGIDAGSVAVMGVCQSGRHPICVGAANASIGAAVVFYGAAQDRDWEVNERQPVAMEDMLARLEVPLFATFAELDHLISLEHVARFRGILEQSRRGYRIRVQSGGPHGFMDSTKPGRFRPEATAESWAALLAFLDANLGMLPSEEDHGRVRWEFSADIAADYDFSRNVRLE